MKVGEMNEMEILLPATFFASKAGLPDFSWCMIPKPEKMYQMNTKCTKWL
jgi:hypothetical protein